MMLFGAAGTAVGLMGGYLLSKPKLRHDLRTADSPKEAFDILARNVRKDTREFAADVRELADRPQVRSGLHRMTRFFHHQAARQDAHKAVKNARNAAEHKITEAKDAVASSAA